MEATTLEPDVRRDRDQQLYAVAHALARYRHEVHRECVGSDEERIVDFLVSLLHFCDERGVCLEAALEQAERLFVDQVDTEAADTELERGAV